MVLPPPLCGPFNDTSTTKARNAEVITVKGTDLTVPYFTLLSPYSLITDQTSKKKWRLESQPSFALKRDAAPASEKLHFSIKPSKW